jgi:hypothetical protein
MASVRKRSDGQWRARYRDGAGKEHAQHFARKVDAQRWIDEITTALVTGQYVDPKAGRVTIKEYAEQRWLPSLVHVRPATGELYRGHLRNHVLPAFGARPIGTLRRTDCKTFVAALATHLAPSTVGTVYAVLRMVMQAAVMTAWCRQTRARGCRCPVSSVPCSCPCRHGPWSRWPQPCLPDTR